ncbi:MAG: hypothetical protein EHM70_13350 [Chloroflexota bacterium]|nr:MAG: hypothetical protein EHM70_13350 [Chloroflexota bacterium]
MADEIQTGKMTPEMVNAMMSKPLLARIATANPKTHSPHVVPVWFLWDGKSIWISTFRSTRKVRELQENPKCSIVVDDAKNGEENEGVIMEGDAELVSQPCELVQDMATRIYSRYLGPKGVLAPDPQSWIHDPDNLLIRLTPRKVYSWYAARKDE